MTNKRLICLSSRRDLLSFAAANLVEPQHGIRPVLRGKQYAKLT
jgi:hypothetical protein